MDTKKFTPENLKSSAPALFAAARRARTPETARERLCRMIHNLEYDASGGNAGPDGGALILTRDCAQALRSILAKRADDLAGFSVAKAVFDLAHDRPRPDLTPAFCADLLHLLTGVQGQAPELKIFDIESPKTVLKGRKASKFRSDQLDRLWKDAEKRLARYRDGYSDPEIVKYREKRRKKIMKVLGATEADWNNWQWHIDNVVRDADLLAKMVKLTKEEKAAVKKARSGKLPFGVTPHFLSLMDDHPTGRDRSVRAQVLPPMDYVREAAAARKKDASCLDFMGEEDTSPHDLITRRYATICILKPFNTCPQICVYCQRNWEIDDAMMPGAYAGEKRIDKALKWIERHTALHEILVTGGDPLAMEDEQVKLVLDRLAAVPTIERIRIGSRTIITMPMRITEELADLIGGYRVPGRREVCLVTHVQHPYEITPEVIRAADSFRTRGIPVYNQLVYTFYASRRFEAAALRRSLRLIGIDPYYTFNTKGKEETRDYRVPIARLLQEQEEETRLLPGVARTDEAVYNVPRLGKCHLRARHYRNFISILPDGARVYEFHPWERNITGNTKTYVSHDVPILDYLERLEAIGEDAEDYESIWYYF